MASKTDVYDIATYFINSNGLITFSNSKFMALLKELPYNTTITSNNSLLDAISYRYYDTELLWWIIALYNDIIDPMNTGLIDLRIPDLSGVEDLLVRFVEEMKS